jgi:hypothetical protein
MVSIDFCDCAAHPRAVRLLRLGFLAASADRPVTAFSMPLLLWLNSLRRAAATPTATFSAALADCLRGRAEPIYGESGQVRACTEARHLLVC